MSGRIDARRLDELEAGMKYLLMIYAPEVDPATVPPEQVRQVAADYDAFTQDISRRGVMLGGEALQPTTTATTVRIQNGRTMITDGPFAETKEALTGFYLVDVADLDEALELAAKLPGANWGSIEVRPIWEVPGEPDPLASSRPRSGGASGTVAS